MSDDKVTTYAWSSAPGKVILFGEHAVVYGVTAIAAALSSLRIYVSINSMNEAHLKIDLLDLKSLGDVMHDPIIVSYALLKTLCPLKESSTPRDTENPTESELLPMREAFSHLPLQASQGVMAICYLVARLLPELVNENVGLDISVKSISLPIGAGLGSSAAFSVALSGALLQIRQKIYHDLLKPEEWGERGANFCCNTELPSAYKSFDLDETRLGSGWTPPPSILTILNSWAYAAEVVIHGAPSGLDNTTCCYGGALKYDRNAGKFETLSKLPDIQILLTNTKVPRSTKQLVAGVRALYDRMPTVIKPIFDSIEGISNKFLDLVEKIAQNSSACLSAELVADIGTLFRINQDLLNAIGVGHHSLSAVSEASQSQGFPCKLTGAGGGGCAITLLDDRDSANCRRIALESKLRELGFESFQSLIAGDGVKWHSVVIN